MASVPPQIIDQETDARFWAQTGYRPGQKLDPANPTDAKMIPVWLGIQAQVHREADAGTLVTTFDHPAVAQHLAAAQGASDDAAVHLNAAARAPDATTAHHHISAATRAIGASSQHAGAAAQVQPPSASPQLTHLASQAAAQDQPPPEAPAADHVANAQAQAADKHRHKHHGGAHRHGQPPVPAAGPHALVPASPAHASRDILLKETDARFWALGYRPGHKLDPHDPTDAKLIPVWDDVFAKVQAEDAAGKLVLTYNNPVVAQHLADAHVADQAAAVHLDAAAHAPDPATAQQHVDGAATAAQVSAHKTGQVARVQPPSVSPQRAHAAAHAAARTPASHIPPTGQHALAHAQAQAVGARADRIHHHHRHGPGSVHGPVRSTLPPHRLPQYRAMGAKQAHAAGAQYVLVVQHPDGSVDHRTFQSRADLDAAYAQVAAHHDHYKYAGAYDLGASPSVPVHDSVGVPAAENVETPPPEGGGVPPHGDEISDAGPPPGDAGAPPETEPPRSKWSGGTIALVVGGIAAGGGLLYAATRKPKRGGGSSKAIGGMPRSPRSLGV